MTTEEKKCKSCKGSGLQYGFTQSEICIDCNGTGITPPETGRESGVDDQEFYELMQTYRHMPLVEQEKTTEAFEAVKKYIRFIESSALAQGYAEGFMNGATKGFSKVKPEEKNPMKKTEVREEIEKVLLNSGHYNQSAKDILDDSSLILSIVREAVSAVKPKGKKHICIFNDGDCKCECYYKSLSNYHSALMEVLS